MTYRVILALVTALAVLGVAAAQTPLPPPASLEHPVAGACANPPPPPDCGPVWFSADYLLGYVYGTRLLPLVTTNTPDTPRAIAGSFNNPNTVTLFGGSRVNADERSGVRVQGGYWLDDGHQCGLEFGGSVLESQSTLFSGFNAGNAILARPFQNALSIAANRAAAENAQNNGGTPTFVNTQEALLVTFPGSTSGGLDIRVSSGNFYELHANVSDNFYDGSFFRLDGLLGYRFYRYDEAVRIRQISTAVNDPNLAAGTQIFLGDDFSTSNEFHGAEVGARGLLRFDNLTLELLAKVAAGNLNRKVNISGGQAITVPGAITQQRVGGFYALSSNSGRQEYNDLASLPEVGFTLRYQLGQNVRLRAGYNALFLSNISRADQQIDQIINPNLLPSSGVANPGVQQPTATQLKDNIWIMNVSVGMEVMF